MALGHAAKATGRLLTYLALSAGPVAAQDQAPATRAEWTGWAAVLPEVVAPETLFARDAGTLAAHLAPLARVSARRTATCVPRFETDAGPPFVSSVLVFMMPAPGTPIRPPNCAPALVGWLTLSLSPARGAVLQDVVDTLTRALGEPEVYLDDEATQWLWKPTEEQEVMVDDRTYGGDPAIHVSAINGALYRSR